MQPDRTAELEALLDRRILLLDGAMGTMIQGYRLDEAGYRGECLAGHPHDVKGDNDLLVLTRPEIVRAIHDAYLEAGADVISTNTFNATSIAQADYRLEGRVRDINVAAAKLARTCADAWTARTPAGSDLPRETPIRLVGFDELTALVEPTGQAQVPKGAHTSLDPMTAVPAVDKP